MTVPECMVVIWLGGLGLVQFDGLWLAVRCLDSGMLQPVGRPGLESIIGHRRRRRVDAWARITPLLTAFSTGLVVTGAILRWTVSS